MTKQPIPLPAREAPKVPVMCRMSPAERAKIECLAGEHRVTMSDLVRIAVTRFLGDVERHGIEEAELPHA